MGQMPLGISPTIPCWTTSPVTCSPHTPGAGSTGTDLQFPPPQGLLHPPESQATSQEWEGDGWEVTGWQAGAASQGKHSTGCSTRDLEITLSYKGKKVQAGPALLARLAQPKAAVAKP